MQEYDDGHDFVKPKKTELSLIPYFSLKIKYFDVFISKAI